MIALTRFGLSSAVDSIAPFGSDRVNNDLDTTEGGFAMPRGTYSRGTIEQRFWAKVEKTDTCWNWTASLRNFGYGRFSVTHERAVMAHRFSFEMRYGEIPDGKQLDHLCRNRACVNPEHLEVVTIRDNVLRGIGITAINRRKAECHRGHTLEGRNLVVRSDGHRACRACLNIRHRLYRERKGAAK